MLYTTTSLNIVVALDARTGTEQWTYDPQIYLNEVGGYTHRGVAYWRDGLDERILVATRDAYLIALDAQTGIPITDFGTEGRVDLIQNLRRPVERHLYTPMSPPIICRDVIIVGAALLDYQNMDRAPPASTQEGFVFTFDRRTGQPIWPIVEKAVPQSKVPGEKTAPTQPFPTKPPPYFPAFLNAPLNAFSISPRATIASFHTSGKQSSA